MRGGCILDVECPTPAGPNPIAGTFSLRKVFLPRDRKHYLIKGPQAYRNLRHHLLAMQNTQMANLFHSAELALEREDDPLTNRIISRTYELASDFGSSALRPFLWWLLFLAITFTFAFHNVDLAQPAEAYVGWRASLVAEGLGAQLARAGHLALQPVVNPLGIYSPRAVLSPGSQALAIWMLVHSLLSLVMIALTILAIRRRFKMH